MTYGELKTYLAATAHRSDLSEMMPFFVNQAQEQINLRFGLALVPFVTDQDTDAVLTDWPGLYFNSAMGFLNQFLVNPDLATFYGGEFDLMASRCNITGNKAATDKYLTSPPVIIPE